MLQQNVTGTPRWQLAREIIAQLREMPAATAEAETEVRLYKRAAVPVPWPPLS